MEVTNIYDKLTSFLDNSEINYKKIEHEASYTSEDSARLRGVNLHSGAKALIVKADDKFIMIVLPADMSLNSNSTRKEITCKKLRFASKEEVDSLTGLQPGSIPPFGSLFNLPSYCDVNLKDNEVIYFNAGMHTRSIGLNYNDFLKLEKPILGSFGEIKNQQ